MAAILTRTTTSPGPGSGIGELAHGYTTCLRNNHPSHVSLASFAPGLALVARPSRYFRRFRQILRRLIILARTNGSGQCSTAGGKHGPDRRHDLLGRQQVHAQRMPQRAVGRHAKVVARATRDGGPQHVGAGAGDRPRQLRIRRAVNGDYRPAERNGEMQRPRIAGRDDVTPREHRRQLAGGCGWLRPAAAPGGAWPRRRARPMGARPRCPGARPAPPRRPTCRQRLPNAPATNAWRPHSTPPDG